MAMVRSRPFRSTRLLYGMLLLEELAPSPAYSPALSALISYW